MQESLPSFFLFHQSLIEIDCPFHIVIEGRNLIFFNDRSKEITAIDFIGIEFVDVGVLDPKLTFPDIAAMLPFGIVFVFDDLLIFQNPIGDLVSPNSKLDKDIATVGLDLLEIHVERLVRVAVQGFFHGIHLRQAFIHRPRSLDFDLYALKP